MERVNVGTNREFDKAVVIRILEVLAGYKKSKLPSPNRSEIIMRLNETPALIEMHPEKFFVNTTSGRTGYVFRILEFLIDQKLIEAFQSHSENRFALRGPKIKFRITKEGEIALNQKESIPYPQRTRQSPQTRE